MRVASFFSGIGGTDLGLKEAGMETVFLCDKDPFCQQVLRKHWPNVTLKGDINDVRPEDVPDAEVWCGGFPCQDLSLANQGKRRGLQGSRSGLFYKFAELLEQSKPDWVIIENVPGLLNANQGQDFRLVLERLDEIGYGVSWRVLDAKYFGTPQRRRRVYLVGSYGSLRSAEVLFESGPTPITPGQSCGEEKADASRFGAGHKETTIYTIQHAGIGRKVTAGPQAKGYRNDGEAYTLDSRGSADAICQTHDAFRIREIPGISGRLDGYRYRSLGNAVCVPVMKWIGLRLKHVSENAQLATSAESVRKVL